MSKILKLCVILLAMDASHVRLSAQDRRADSLIYRAALENTISKSLKFQQAINIGSEYDESIYDFRKGHQWFLTPEEFTGDVIYNKVLYRNLIVQYDIVRDELITKHMSGRRIVLTKEKVSWFTINGYVFEHFMVFGANRKMKPGYYNVVADEGGIKLLARRAKKIVGQASHFNNRVAKSQVNDKLDYFLYHEGTFTAVSNAKNISKLLWGKEKPPALTITKGSLEEDRMISIVKQYANLRR